jgi:AcrR family transcriptional regulator
VTSIDSLFEELVARWRRDEPLDVDELLSRAGGEADQLAALIDSFFERAPRRAPSLQAQEAITDLATRLEREPPLVSARVAARRRVRDVTQALIAGCGLPPDAEDLVRSYYQRLEGGLLDPAGVSDKIWAVLDNVLGLKVRTIAQAGFASRVGLGPAPSLVYQRVATPDSSAPAAAPLPVSQQPADEIRREVERLFTAHTAD